MKLHKNDILYLLNSDGTFPITEYIVIEEQKNKVKVKPNQDLRVLGEYWIPDALDNDGSVAINLSVNAKTTITFALKTEFHEKINLLSQKREDLINSLTNFIKNINNIDINYKSDIENINKIDNMFNNIKQNINFYNNSIINNLKP